jgi:hypothetical protein
MTLPTRFEKLRESFSDVVVLLRFQRDRQLEKPYSREHPGMMARVIGVSASAAAAGLKFHVSGSMSANTGRAPACTMVFAVAQNVSGVVTTSSFCPTPAASSER